MTAAAETTPESGPVKYITAASMIDCTGAAAAQNPVIVLKGKRIDRISTGESIKIPPGADVIDCGGCTLIPGMMRRTGQADLADEPAHLCRRRVQNLLRKPDHLQRKGPLNNRQAAYGRLPGHRSGCHLLRTSNPRFSFWETIREVQR